MDLEPYTSAPPWTDVAEEEQERGITRPFIIDDEDDVDEYGLDGFPSLNSALLLPLEDEAAISPKTKKLNNKLNKSKLK